MFSARGANVFTETATDLDEYFAGARWYHFSGYTLLAQPQHDTAMSGLEIARSHRCRSSLDPGLEPAMSYGKQIKQLLPKIDIFFPNEQEVIVLTQGKQIKDAVEELLDNGARAIVVKRGGKGCIIAYDKKYYEIPAFDIQVKDTTGAGDSFNAGIVLGRMVGLSWPASAVLGNALGAMTSSMKGSGAGSITFRQVEELISKDQFKPRWAQWRGAMEEVLAWL